MVVKMDKIVKRQSRVGKKSVFFPKSVSVEVNGRNVLISGPHGVLSSSVSPLISLFIVEQKVEVTVPDFNKFSSRLQGTTRALIQNMVHGVSVTYGKTLQLIGTGYKAEVLDSCVHLFIGFSHPVIVPIPLGVRVSIPPASKGTLISIEGVDKVQVGQIASTIRSFRPCEPYGGKGVRYHDEIIKRKEGKSGKNSK